MISQQRTSSNMSEMVAAGSNESGQFGFGVKNTSKYFNSIYFNSVVLYFEECKKYEKPKFFSYNIKITGISCGFNHTAFIVDDHLIYTVGSNEYGKLGVSDPKLEFSSSPCLIDTLTNYIVKKVACGLSHTAVITNEGDIFTWGNGLEGQLGVGDTPNSINIPFQLNFDDLKAFHNFKKFKEISCGEKHTLVLSENGLCFGWGSSEFGQLGTGKNEKEVSPIFLSFFAKKTIKSIACGYSHTLFLTKSKNVYASGFNSHGELGLGTNIASYLPVKLSKIQHENVVSIHAGNHSAAITEKGDLYLWGSGTFGELLFPLKINDINQKFVDVSLGFGFGIAVDINGQLHFWGDNQCGQLGFGDYQSRSTLTQNQTLQDKKTKMVSCGGQHFIALFEEDEKILQKKNIIDNIMNDMTTSKKKPEEEVSNRKVIVNNTETKNKRTSKKSTLKENQKIKETIKIKSLFNQDENNITGLKSLESSKRMNAKTITNDEKPLKHLSTSFDVSNNANNGYKNHVKNNTGPSLNVSHGEMKNFYQKQDNEFDNNSDNLLMKNKQNGMEFKIKIKEYEDIIKLLQLKEKNVKNMMKEQERNHNEKYHELSQIYNQLKIQYESINDDFSSLNERFDKESLEKKKIEDKLRLFAREKYELNQIFSNQSRDIEAINESFMILANEMEKKDKDIIKLYNLKEKDKRMIQLLKTQLEESIIKVDLLENKKHHISNSETENFKQILEKKENELLSLKSEIEHLHNESENLNKDKIIQLENLIQQKDLENDQMKTIIFELNTQNKYFREEIEKKNQLRSPEFQELKENSDCTHTHSNMSQLDSKRMELNELEQSNRYEDVCILNSPDIDLITPTEQKKKKSDLTFETPLVINGSVNSFGEQKNELKDVSNINLMMSEKKTEFLLKFKKTPIKKNEVDKENGFSKTSTERNDGLLESISSSVYEKIVMSNKSLNNIKSRLTDLQKNRNVLEERMKDFESKLSV